MTTIKKIVALLGGKGQPDAKGPKKGKKASHDPIATNLEVLQIKDLQTALANWIELVVDILKGRQNDSGLKKLQSEAEQLISDLKEIAAETVDSVYNYVNKRKLPVKDEDSFDQLLQLKREQDGAAFYRCMNLLSELANYLTVTENAKILGTELTKSLVSQLNTFICEYRSFLSGSDSWPQAEKVDYQHLKNYFQYQVTLLQNNGMLPMPSTCLIQ